MRILFLCHLCRTLRHVVHWLLSVMVRIVKIGQYVLILILASNCYSGFECTWRNGRLKAWQQRCNKSNRNFLLVPFTSVRLRPYGRQILLLASGRQHIICCYLCALGGRHASCKEQNHMLLWWTILWPCITLENPERNRSAVLKHMKHHQA